MPAASFLPVITALSPTTRLFQGRYKFQGLWLLCLTLLCTGTQVAQASPTPYNSAPVSVSATATTRIEAEDYDKGGESVAYHDTDNGGQTARRSDNVGVYEDVNTSGGYGVGWTGPGEWYGYTINVAQAGSYALTARIGSDHSGGHFHLEFGPIGQVGGGALSSAEFVIPYARGWVSYEDVSVPAVSLPAGPLWMRVVVDDPYPCNFDFFRLTPIASFPTATGITINPSTTANGGRVNGYVTLSGPAPVGGMALSLSCDSASVQIPASVTVYQGGTYGYFGVATSPVSSATTAHITAADAGDPVTASLTLLPAVSLTSFFVGTPALGGNTTYGYVSLNGPAPAGGLTVTLSSDNAAAQVPATVTVPAGYNYWYFPITTSAVTAPVTTHITAAAAGASFSAPLTIVQSSPVVMDYFGLFPDTVHGGDPTDGYIQLTDSAPDGGLTFTLSSDSPLVTVPASITIGGDGDEGDDEGDFTITTSPVSTPTQVHITASGPGGPMTTLLTLTPLSAPSNLTASAFATAPAMVRVTLNWAGATGATGYAIERSHDYSTWTQVGTSTVTSFQDPSAVAGTYYYYRVKATNGGGSAYSNSAYVNTALPYLVATDLWWLPDPVFSGDHVRFFAVIQNIGTGPSNPFSWTVEFEGDPGETGYNIEANSLAPGDTLLVTEQFNQWWTANGGEHDIQVVIDDSYVSLTKTLYVACLPPANLTPVSAPGGGINLSWQPSVGATSYNLYRGTSPGSETLYKSGLTGTACQDAGLTSGQTYYYKISAVVAALEGDLSAEASAVPGPGTGAGTITGLDFGFETPDVGNSFFQLNPSGSPWTFNGLTGISGNYSGYSFYSPQAPEGVQVGIVRQTGSISQMLTSSAPGAWTVTFSATQCYNGGWNTQALQVLLDSTVIGTITPAAGAYSDYTLGPLTLPAGPHQLSFVGTNPQGRDNIAFIDNVRPMLTAQGVAAPTGLTASAGNGQIILAWTPPSGAASYNLYRSTAAGGEGTTPYKTGLTGTTYADTNVTPGTTYYYTVTAVSPNGESAPSNEASAVPQPATTPDFSLTVNPSLNVPIGTINAPSHGAVAVNVAAINNFIGNVVFSVTGLPTGVTAHFSNLSVTGSGGSTLTLTVDPTAATVGSTTLTVTGTSGSLVHSKTLTLNIISNGGNGVSGYVWLADIYLPKTMVFACGPYTDLDDQDHHHEFLWTDGAGHGTSIQQPPWVDTFDFQFGVSYTIVAKLHRWGRNWELIDPATNHYDWVYYDTTQTIGTLPVMPMQAEVIDNQVVDARYDPRYSTYVFVNHKFGTTTYRGGLFAGYNADNSQVGHSYLKFLLPPPATGQTVMPVASINTWFTRDYDLTGGSKPDIVGVACQSVPSYWDSTSITWANAPAFSPSQTPQITVPDPQSTSANPFSSPWIHWEMGTDVGSILSAGGGLYSVALSGTQEPAIRGEGPPNNAYLSGWAYFAKKEYASSEAAVLLYALSGTAATAHAIHSPHSVAPSKAVFPLPSNAQTASSAASSHAAKKHRPSMGK